MSLYLRYYACACLCVHAYARVCVQINIYVPLFWGRGEAITTGAGASANLIIFFNILCSTLSLIADGTPESLGDDVRDGDDDVCESTLLPLLLLRLRLSLLDFLPDDRFWLASFFSDEGDDDDDEDREKTGDGDSDAVEEGNDAYIGDAIGGERVATRREEYDDDVEEEDDETEEGAPNRSRQEFVPLAPIPLALDAFNMLLSAILLVIRLSMLMASLLALVSRLTLNDCITDRFGEDENKGEEVDDKHDKLIDDAAEGDIPESTDATDAADGEDDDDVDDEKLSEVKYRRENRFIFSM